MSDVSSVEKAAGDFDPRSAARLAAVQALFQMEATGVGAKAAAGEFLNHRFPEWFRDGAAGEPDEELFREIVYGVAESQTALDDAIRPRLRSDWRLSRIDPTLRSILRAAAFELRRPGGPGAAVVIDEYVNVTKAFFDREEASFVNGALDALARAAGG